jgi:hypothetical protein
VTAKLKGFDKFLWTKCPVDPRMRRANPKLPCGRLSKTFACMDLSASLARRGTSVENKHSTNIEPTNRIRTSV